MPDRDYRILVAKDRAGIEALANQGGWTVLQPSVKEFRTLDTADDQTFGNIGEVVVNGPGFVALAFKA